MTKLSKDEINNWERIKQYFDELPEDKRENMFYRRAVAISEGKEDPLK